MKPQPLTEFPLPHKPIDKKWIEKISPISRFIAETAFNEGKKKIEEINNKNNIK